jgi:hypothetical protein
MRRLLISIAVLTALLAVPAGAGAAVIGVSDQQASTFANPDFAALKLKAARYITPYDVMEDPAEKSRLEAWLTAARGAHQKILISFEHSHRSNSRALKAPSVAAYTKELKKFKKAYAFVHDISPWNEVNRCHSLRDGSVQGQPTKLCKVGTGPKLAAQYYMAAHKVFKGSKYRIVGIDILDQKDVNPTIKYLKSFLRHASPDPKIIGLHNYSDTNRFSDTRTKRVLQTFRGKVWLTETGGEVKLGTSFPFDTQRAARALGCMFAIAKNPRISGVFVYQFNPPADPSTAFFDAGLINPDNSLRPGYAVVKSRKARSCHK